MGCKNNGTKIGQIIEKRNDFRVLRAPFPDRLTQKRVPATENSLPFDIYIRYEAEEGAKSTPSCPFDTKKEFPRPRTLYFQNLDDVEISGC